MSAEQKTSIALESADSAASDLSTSEVQTSYPRVDQRLMAWLDIKEGMQKWPIWMMLAYQDIKLRYRRSVLGPFWITLSMAITVYTMGFLYGHLFRMDLQQYYPFLVAGMLTWSLISSSITELTDTFMSYDSLIKQIKLPYSLYLHRVVTRNVIIFFHNLIVMLPIYFIFSKGAKINLYSLLMFVGLAIIYINAIAYGTVLAMIGSRFRDVSQIIKSLIQVVFFMTPIMWNPSVLPESERYLMYLNPFYSFVDLVRAPLLGVPFNFINIAITLSFTLIGCILCFYFLVRYRVRIIYWL